MYVAKVTVRKILSIKFQRLRGVTSVDTTHVGSEADSIKTLITCQMYEFELI